MKRTQQDGIGGGAVLVVLWGRGSRRASRSTAQRWEGTAVRVRRSMTICGVEHSEGKASWGGSCGEEGESGEGWGFHSTCDRVCGVLRKGVPGLINALQRSLQLPGEKRL